MKENINIEEVSMERWMEAQKAELACWINEPNDNEDWNSWWSSKFLNYQFLQKEKKIESIYEVGCGPYAKNIELVCRSLGYTPKRILLEDPLIDQYISLNKSVKRFSGYANVKLFNKPMEQFSLAEHNVDPVDILICNNVLDHVQSVEACFQHMFSSLKDDGILIFGQDLTSNEDAEKHAKINDPCHPIKIDEDVVRKYIKPYDKIYENVLSRAEGRNPEYHYATFIFAGRKKKI